MRRIGIFLAVVSIVPSSLVIWIDGHFPASVPASAAPYSVAPLKKAYQHVDPHSGAVDMELLVNERQPLDEYVAQLASSSPDSEPFAFPTARDKLAFWLNAYHAIVLQQMLDAWPSAKTTQGISFYRRTWPIGGSRRTLFSIERRHLKEAADARVYLALFTGARGSGLLDGVPFEPATIESQLNDAAKRFIRRKENVSISGTTVTISSLFKTHEQEFLAALPPERRNVLQVIWAYLPDTCEGERPGCDTRGDLDKACGSDFQKCAVIFAPLDVSLAVRQAN